MEVQMFREQVIKGLSFTFLLMWWILSTPVYAEDMGLVDLLSNQLGVTRHQAEGGAGSIFQLAKQNLSVEDFYSIAEAIPGIDEMMDAAPKAEGSSTALGSVSSMIGGNSNKLGGLAGLTSAFGKLGMTGDMVGKFIPIVLDYAKDKGGEHVMSLLKGVLS